MKKILIALSFLPLGLISNNSSGQISSGTVLVGGSVGGSISSGSSATNKQEFKNTTFSFSPTAGFFIANNLAVGLNSGVYWQKQKTQSEITSKYSSYNFGPFVRYYKFLGEKTALFGNATVGFAKSNSKLRNNDNEFVTVEKTNNFGASITPGLTYFATSKVGLEITLGSISYFKNSNEYNSEETPADKRNDSGVGANFGLNNAALGIKFYLARQ